VWLLILRQRQERAFIDVELEAEQLPSGPDLRFSEAVRNSPAKLEPRASEGDLLRACSCYSCHSFLDIHHMHLLTQYFHNSRLNLNIPLSMT
jgi:hypothetical protein